MFRTVTIAYVIGESSNKKFAFVSIIHLRLFIFVSLFVVVYIVVLSASSVLCISLLQLMCTVSIVENRRLSCGHYCLFDCVLFQSIVVVFVNYVV